MNKIALPLDGNYIRPTIRIGTMKVLIDTGAIVSVWTQSEENLIRLFHAKDTKLSYDLKGFHDMPVKCKIYMIHLTIEKVTFYHVPIAVKKNADYIFQTDSDGQTDSDEFWKFWEQRNKFDMIIGNRNNRKDGISRVFVTKILKLVIQICFKCSITDANTPFRLMSRETLKENLKYVPRDFNLSNVILSVVYVKRGMRVKFMPITFKKRQGGVNSINLRKIFKIGINALRDFIIINRSLKNI